MSPDAKTLAVGEWIHDYTLKQACIYFRENYKKYSEMDKAERNKLINQYKKFSRYAKLAGGLETEDLFNLSPEARDEKARKLTEKAQMLEKERLIEMLCDEDSISIDETSEDIPDENVDEASKDPHYGMSIFSLRRACVLGEKMKIEFRSKEDRREKLTLISRYSDFKDDDIAKMSRNTLAAVYEHARTKQKFTREKENDLLLRNDEKRGLFERLKFTLTVCGASDDGKENKLKKLWENADIQNLMDRIDIRPTFRGRSDKRHSFTSRSTFTSRTNLRLEEGSVYIHNKEWTPSSTEGLPTVAIIEMVDFSMFTSETTFRVKLLRNEHQLAWYIKTQPKLMNPNLTDDEENAIMNCNLKYFPVKKKAVNIDQGIINQISMTEAIELNREKFYGKPEEVETRGVDTPVNLDEIKKKARESKTTLKTRIKWSDFEEFVTTGARSREMKESAKNDIDWKAIRDKCTSLACTFTAQYRQSANTVLQQFTLYEKNEAGVWSQVGRNLAPMINRLKVLYPKKKDEGDNKKKGN